MVSERVISELRDEMHRLRKKADLIAEFLRGVSDEQQVQAQEQQEVPAAATNGHGYLTRIHNIPVFAQQVRESLRSLGRTATSAEVADRLIAAGVDAERNGKPLRNTVAVELFRMAKKPRTSGVSKVARGRYRMDTVSQEGCLTKP